MNLVPTSSKHRKAVSLDAIAFYYARGLRVLPALYLKLIDSLSDLERQGKVCLTPKAILERYHLQLHRRIETRIRKIAKMIS